MGIVGKSKKRIVWTAVAILTFLFVLAFLLLPVLVSSDKGREVVLAKINSSVEGHTDFTSLSMGWLRGIEITGIRFNDNAGQLSVQIAKVSTKPHYCSLLTGALSFGKTIIDKPKVEINLKNTQPDKMRVSGQPNFKFPDIYQFTLSPKFYFYV